MVLNILDKDIDLNNKRIKNDDNNPKKELIKELRKGLEELSEILNSMGIKKIENKLLLKD